MSTTEATPAEIEAWFQERVPAEWKAAGAPVVTVDREEITVVLTVAAPDTAADASPGVVAEAAAGRVAGFRDDTRERRMSVARDAEHRFERKVAWGVRVGDTTTLFTHLAVPVMTRLRQPERVVLDTLVASGVARSRADALSWCVRLVGRHTDEWLSGLRRALEDVERLRSEGPGL